MRFPNSTIQNGHIKAKLLLPDSINGYYRGTRFDWSGIIPRLTYKGHEFFGKWFKKYNPKSHQAVMGPAEAFDPLGYEEAEIGGTFIKIGVGELLKDANDPYKAFKTYSIKNHGVWELTESESEIKFVHTLNAEKYSYIYTKTIRFIEDIPKMTIEHTLENTSGEVIFTNLLNHNFFYIDKEGIGPAYKLKVPFAIRPEGRVQGIGELAEIDTNGLFYKKQLKHGEQVYIENMYGYNPNDEEYNVCIENTKSRAGVKIKGDKPLSKFVFWSTKKAICPEPYITVKAKPGQSFKWNVSYTFYNY